MIAEPHAVVIVGADVTVDRENLERWCAAWADDLGVAISVEVVADERALAQSLGLLASEDIVGLVLCPGRGAESDWLRSTGASVVPIVWVDLDEAERPRPPYVDQAGMSIRGRGADGVRWALRLLLQRQMWPYQTISYGPERDHVGDLRLPTTSSSSLPVVVLLHGGFWRERWERDTIEPLAIDLARRGYATWNLEYRRVGPFGGGWPATGVDVAAGIDHLALLAESHSLDLARLVIAGHSAGGHLALWAAKRRGIAGEPTVRPSLIVSLAGVADLVESSLRGLGDTGNGTAAFIGGSPEALPEAYAAASPLAALPLEVPQLVVQGRLDNIPDLVDLSRCYARAAREAGDDVTFLELDDAGHFDVIDPASSAWPPIVAEIGRLLAKAP
jgi:acetyl esterase/lipase